MERHGHGLLGGEAYCQDRVPLRVQDNIAKADADGVQIHQYATGRYTGDVAGNVVIVNAHTDFPLSGAARFTVVDCPTDRLRTLSLRIPQWCTDHRIAVTGGEPTAAATDSGRLRLERRWTPGGEVTLELAVTPRLVTADPRVDAVRGCVAIERGPLVYCLEGVDNPGGLDDLVIDVCRPLFEEPHSELLGGIVIVTASGHRRTRPDECWWPYRDLVDADRTAGRHTRPEADVVSLTSVPYYARANRQDGPMRVWIPTWTQPSTRSPTSSPTHHARVKDHHETHTLRHRCRRGLYRTDRDRRLRDQGGRHRQAHRLRHHRPGQQGTACRSAGQPPDVMLVDNPVVSTLVQAAILTKMSEVGVSTTSIQTNVIGAGTLKGSSYGVPIGANTLALYYNKNVVDAAHVDPASIKDWDSLTAALAKVKAAGNKGITFSAIGTEEGSFQFLPWLWGAKGDTADPELKPWRQAVAAARGRTSGGLGVRYPVISQQLWTAVQAALSGGKSPEAALKAAQSAADSHKD